MPNSDSSKSGSLGGILVAAFFVLFSCSASAQSPSGNILIVFDSSGSMWGALKGGFATKFEIARAALGKTLPDAKEGVGTGLLIFGPGCRTAGVAPQPGLRPAQQTLAPLNQLNPRSKGPIALALEQGLDALDASKPASMLLVIDGPDNCRRDPCEVAQRIAKERPGLKLHTVGLGIGPAPARSVACMSKLTNGRFFSATTAEQAEKAIEDAVKLAMADTQILRGPKLARKPGLATKPRAKYDPNGPPHLVLDATIGPKKDQLVEKPVRWRVYKASTEAEGDGLPILDVLEPTFSVPVAPGSYKVVAALGRARFEAPVKIAKRGPTRLTAKFEAGLVKLSVPASPAGDESQVAALVTVSRIAGKDGGTASHVPFVISPYRKGELILPAGRYLVRATSGSETVERKIDVSTGHSQDVSLALGTGELSLSAIAQVSGKQVGDLEFLVSVDDPDRPGGRRSVARSAAINPSFRLPAGTYYVDVQSGLAKTSDRVALGAGQVVSRSLVLPLARIRVVADISTGRDARRRPVVFKLYSVGSSLDVLARSSADEPHFLVPPGRYRVVAEVGARNVRVAETVEVEVGADERIELGVLAGDIKLRVADAKGRPLTGQFWEVRDAAGQTIWRTQQSAPTGLLSPGRYEVRCETRRGIVEGAFVVAAGDTKTVELRVQ